MVFKKGQPRKARSESEVNSYESQHMPGKFTDGVRLSVFWSCECDGKTTAGVLTVMDLLIVKATRVPLNCEAVCEKPQCARQVWQ